MILSKKSNICYSIGVCPEFLLFIKGKRRVYEENSSPQLENELKSLEERGVIKDVNCKQNQFTLTLLLKKNGQTAKEVEIEGVDSLQCLFFISQLENMSERGCRQPCCELPCCVLKRLDMVL